MNRRIPGGVWTSDLARCLRRPRFTYILFCAQLWSKIGSRHPSLLTSVVAAAAAAAAAVATAVATAISY